MEKKKKRKDNWIVASHLPDTANVAADDESRSDRRELEQKLHSLLLLFFFSHKIQFLLGVNGAVGLFVSGVNNQLARYVAWKPGPGAWKTDAFSVNWTFFSSGLCFPAFCLIARVSQRIELWCRVYSVHLFFFFF